MSQGLLVINAGSSSIKFSVFVLPGADHDDLSLVCRGVLESIGEENPHFKALDASGDILIDVRPTPPSGRYRKAGADYRRRATDTQPSPADGQVYDHESALRDLLSWLKEKPDLPDVVAAGHRVVHGGKEFSDPQRLTPDVITRLEAFIPCLLYTSPSPRD